MRLREELTQVTLTDCIQIKTQAWSSDAEHILPAERISLRNQAPGFFFITIILRQVPV